MIQTLPDVILRAAVFMVVLVLMMALEALWPRKRRVQTRLPRWSTNLTIVVLGALLVRALAWIATTLAVPLVAVAAAIVAERHGLGLLNMIEVPAAVRIVVAVVALDFAIWFQHWAAHTIPVLWRVHRMHHADRDIDVTTALRFHPVEIGLSMLWKALCVLVLGAPVVAVVAFEIILNALAMFNHANVALPTRLDRILRAVIVTPDMHRVHHSVHRGEHNANYGFNLSIWDRLFRTYVAQPRDGHEAMRIGLDAYQDNGPERLGWSLRLPFRR